MPETIVGNLYDYPEYYDLIFGADWKEEYRFLEDCFELHARREVRRLFEPACGTGRLLVRFAKAGYAVGGNDLNANAIAFCNQRLEKQGFPATAKVGDMANFRLPRKVDAAFNTINSFRHLPNEQSALAHLQCMAAAIARGGLYILGLHLSPRQPPEVDEEHWSASRGKLSVRSRMWSININRRTRIERVGLTFDVVDGVRTFRLQEEMNFRMYSRQQIAKLLAQVPEFELVETYDFGYDIENPVEVDDSSEDTLFVLRRK